MSDRRYAISEYKLSQLREWGVFPSVAGPVAVTAWGCVTCGLFVSILFSFPYFLKQYANILAVMAEPLSEGQLPEAVVTFCVMALGLLIAILCLAATSIVLVGALFNRRLLSFSNFSFSWSFSSLRQLLSPGGAIKRSFLSLVRNLLGLVSSVGLAFWGISFLRKESEKSLSAFVSSSMTSSEVIFSSLKTLFAQAPGCLAVLLAAYVFISLIQRVAAVVLFRRQHRMTREELLAEAKETALSPELRQQMQESYIGD